jgi:hypothetical protein
MTYDHVEKFKIGDQDIELGFINNNGCWYIEVLKGDTGTGTMSGGSPLLSDQIARAKQQHTYSYGFFKRGENNSL